MVKIKKYFTSALAVLMIAGSVGLTSCSGVTEEQMAELQALKEEVTALEQEITELKSEKTKLEREIAELNAKLDQCAKDKAETQKNLQKIGK
ncbi:MAG: hypothetical protein V1720_02670 [bacterium]